MFSVLVVVLRPDHIAGQGIEKIVRNEIFKENWNRSSASIKESRPPTPRRDNRLRLLDLVNPTAAQRGDWEALVGLHARVTKPAGRTRYIHGRRLATTSVRINQPRSACDPEKPGAPEGSLDPRAPLPLPTRSPGGRSSKSVSVFYGWLGAA
jgi:hypothetical protein